MPSILLITLEKIVTLCCFFLLCKSYLYSNFLTTSLNKHFPFTAIIPTCNLSFVTLRHNFCLQSILIHYKYEFIFTTSTQGQQTFMLSWCKLFISQFTSTSSSVLSTIVQGFVDILRPLKKFYLTLLNVYVLFSPMVSVKVPHSEFLIKFLVSASIPA